jgi:hypothetical protein
MLKIELGKPVRFLAVQWQEDWEFDFPAVLLEPVLRYDPNGGGAEGLIEDAAIDTCLALESGEPLWDENDSTTTEEFAWRGWNLKNLRRVAREALNGKDFPVKCYEAEEVFYTFKKLDDGTVGIEEWGD